MFNRLVLKDWSVASFVIRVGQDKYYVFLICSQEKNTFIFKKEIGKSQNIRKDHGQGVYERCTHVLVRWYTLHGEGSYLF